MRGINKSGKMRELRELTELAMTPAKNLVIMIVWMLVAVAVAAEKHMKMNMGRRTDIRRPYISEKGLRYEMMVSERLI